MTGDLGVKLRRNYTCNTESVAAILFFDHVSVHSPPKPICLPLLSVALSTNVEGVTLFCLIRLTLSLLSIFPLLSPFSPLFKVVFPSFTPLAAAAVAALTAAWHPASADSWRRGK